jgi:class 3 adenylate cyclase
MKKPLKRAQIPKRKTKKVPPPAPPSDSEEIAPVFVDIEDSTGIANHYASEDYRDFLTSFHKCVQSVVHDDNWEPIREAGYHNFFGDEFMAFIPSAKYPSPISSALDLACRLKIAWYLSDQNEERLQSDKEIIELNIGVNLGTVHRMPYPLTVGVNRPFTLEGFPITVAKRAQSVCEEGRASRIVLADRAYRDYVRKSHRSYDFSYMGRLQLKGFTQALSCYEWLGDDFDTSLDSSRLEEVTSVLYQKNPLNAWYALLLARCYFHRAEDEWYRGNQNNKWYTTTASLCLSALQTITWSKLRTITNILLTCLEVQKKWGELAFRAEQAFVNDPTFAYALGFRAKALLGRYMDEGHDKLRLVEAEREAQRAITLFQHDDEANHEPLFVAHLVQSAVHAVEGRDRNAIESLEKAAEQAQGGGIRWAGDEILDLSENVFKNLEQHPQWKQLLGRLKAIRESE